MIESGLRIGFSLIVVFALMWGIAKVVRKPLSGRGGELLTVVARQQMSRGASVAVVQIADRALIIGVTENQVTLLAETDLAALELSQAEPVRRSPVRLLPDGDKPVLVPDLDEAAAPRTAARRATPSGRFAGSALSPQTWSATIDFLRERTVRK